MNAVMNDYVASAAARQAWVSSHVASCYHPTKKMTLSETAPELLPAEPWFLDALCCSCMCIKSPKLSWMQLRCSLVLNPDHPVFAFFTVHPSCSLPTAAAAALHPTCVLRVTMLTFQFGRLSQAACKHCADACQAVDFSSSEVRLVLVTQDTTELLDYKHKWEL